MTIQNDQQHYQFCIAILKRLHLAPKPFFKAVAHQKRYESLVYIWINQLFTRNISIEKSLQLIYEARHRAFFYGTITELPTKKKHASLWTLPYYGLPLTPRGNISKAS